jgi:hypothetical protein
MFNRNTFRIYPMIAAGIMVAAGVLMLSGCGSTQLVDIWKDPAYTTGPLSKIMVIAMQPDGVRRRIWEDAFVSEFQKKDKFTTAVPSYTMFPDRVPDTLAMQEKLKEQNFDGVLMVARGKMTESQYEVPGYVSDEAVTVYRPRWNRYVTRYEEIYYPGYIASDTTIHIHSELMLAREEGRLLWASTSETVDPTSGQQLRGSVADAVVDNLKKVDLVK